MTYLLDSNILSCFLQCRREAELASAAARVSLAIVEEVRVELEADPQRGRGFATWFRASNIAPRVIELGSHPHATLADLAVGLSGSRGRGLGERASIALAVHDADLVFVTSDKGALWIALGELHARGERIIGLPVFLRRLHEDGGLSVDAARDVMTVSSLRKPTWWAGWLAPRASA